MCCERCEAFLFTQNYVIMSFRNSPNQEATAMQSQILHQSGDDHEKDDGTTIVRGED